MRSRAVRRPLLCWFSMFFAPPPSRIFSSSLWTCDMRSARKRMLASYRAEVGSTFVVSAFEAWDDGSVVASLRSAMGQEIGLFTVYQSHGGAQRKRTPTAADTRKTTESNCQRGRRSPTGCLTANGYGAATPENAAPGGVAPTPGRPSNR